MFQPFSHALNRGGMPPLPHTIDILPYTCDANIEAVRGALASAGFDHSKYCIHSFRIGAATTAAAKGIEDAVIKTLGRWDTKRYTLRKFIIAACGFARHEETHSIVLIQRLI